MYIHLAGGALIFWGSQARPGLFFFNNDDNVFRVPQPGKLAAKLELGLSLAKVP
jgi:hypothetical protein